jgi:hypothetical protein
MSHHEQQDESGDVRCRYLRLDGSTNRVQRMIDIAQFQAPASEIFIYILNTRAGGYSRFLTAIGGRCQQMCHVQPCCLPG